MKYMYMYLHKLVGLKNAWRTSVLFFFTSQQTLQPIHASLLYGSRILSIAI